MTGGLGGEFLGVTPQLTLDDVEAVRFYRAAFGADRLLRHPGPDGRVMHSELLLNGGWLLLLDHYSADRSQAPAVLGDTGVSTSTRPTSTTERCRHCCGLRSGGESRPAAQCGR